MPSNLVKTPADERHWATAKKFCHSKGYTGDRLYQCTNGTFQRIKDSAAKAGKQAVRKKR